MILQLLPRQMKPSDSVHPTIVPKLFYSIAVVIRVVPWHVKRLELATAQIEALGRVDSPRAAHHFAGVIDSKARGGGVAAIHQRLERQPVIEEPNHRILTSVADDQVGVIDSSGNSHA